MTGTRVRSSRATTRDDVQLPHQVVDYGRGSTALRTMRDEMAAMSELTYDGSTDAFTARISTFHMSSALLLEGRFPKIRQDRTPLLVARSGIDHYLVVLYLRGQC